MPTNSRNLKITRSSEIRSGRFGRKVAMHACFKVFTYPILLVSCGLPRVVNQRRTRSTLPRSQGAPAACRFSMQCVPGASYQRGAGEVANTGLPTQPNPRPAGVIPSCVAPRAAFRNGIPVDHSRDLSTWLEVTEIICAWRRSGSLPCNSNGSRSQTRAAADCFARTVRAAEPDSVA